jgi:L-ascorbate metabolism protein UlaG (beta-lactamase superfamily)
MRNPIPHILFAGLLASLIAGCAAQATPQPTAAPEPTVTSVPATATPTVEEAVSRLHWFGTSAILYHGSKNIYFDPVNLSGDPPPADLIFISHGHADHADVASLVRIIGPNTKLVVGPGLSAFYEKNKDVIGIPATVINAGESITVDGVPITAVPAYDTAFHPRAVGDVGFVVTVDGERIYFAGGTNFYPEMARIESDITLYPMYTKDDVQKVIKVLPTEVLILVHTSGPGAQAFADSLAPEAPNLRIMALDPGPYNP